MRLQQPDDLTTTRDHWYWRPGWAPGRRMYTFHLTFAGSDDLHRLVRELQEPLAGIDELDLVSIDGLHLTMTGVGFTDEVTDAQLDQIADEVFAVWAEIVDAEVEFDSIFVGHEGVLLCAVENSWLRYLLTAQRGAVDAVLGPQQWGEFWPHVSLAYANGEVPADRIVRALDEAADDADKVVEAEPRLTLMRLGRDENRYEWTVVREA